MAKGQALQTNMDVDYVVVYKFEKRGECMSVWCKYGGLRRDR